MIKGFILQNKTLKKIIYTGNFPIEDQIKSIKYSLKKEFNEEKISKNILNKTYNGSKYNNYLILEDSGKKYKKREQIQINEVLPIDSILWIIDSILENKIHRNFIISIKNDKLITKDILFKKEKTFILEKQYQDYQIFFDSRFLSYFKLNKKTLTKKSKIIISNNGFGILFNRKKRNFFFFKYN
jgi:hypothetical protein